MLGALSPRRRGSRLWIDAKRIRLEGEEPRFPIEVVSFAAAFRVTAISTALWHLDWRPGDWTREFEGVVRLLVNADRPDFVDRVVAGDPATVQAMIGDVMSHVVERALADEDCVEAIASHEEETLGGQVAAWLRPAWPGQGAAQVRGMFQTHPARVRAALQGVALVDANA